MWFDQLVEGPRREGGTPWTGGAGRLVTQDLVAPQDGRPYDLGRSPAPIVTHCFPPLVYSAGIWRAGFRVQMFVSQFWSEIHTHFVWKSQMADRFSHKRPTATKSHILRARTLGTEVYVRTGGTDKEVDDPRGTTPSRPVHPVLKDDQLVLHGGTRGQDDRPTGRDGGLERRPSSSHTSQIYSLPILVTFLRGPPAAAPLRHTSTTNWSCDTTCCPRFPPVPPHPLERRPTGLVIIPKVQCPSGGA